MTRAELDIGDRVAVQEAVRSLKPSLIINAAAYTAVDKAEDEPDAAFRINRDAVRHLAEAAHATGARFLHVSTDYVFDGMKATPYLPQDAPNPLGVYGASKLAGEKAARDATDGAALVVRTAWVYAVSGRNFVNTMLKLMRDREEVRVVADQRGTPTHAGSLARALGLFAQISASGLYHWTDGGEASWYEFALAIRAAASRCGQAGLARVTPISTAEYPTRARRPAYTVLDKTSARALIGAHEDWPTPLAPTVAAILSATPR